MLAKKYFILILLASLSLLLLIGCRANVGFEGKSNSIIKEQAEIDDSEGSESAKIIPENNDEVLNSEDKNEKLHSTNSIESRFEILGRWHLEKIALKSDAYDGTSEDVLGGIDEEDYVGFELEFAEKYLRLGEDKFLNPKYTFNYMTVAEYNNGGKFRLPDAYGCIRNENINIVNSKSYKELSDVPLKFYQASFEQDYFIPVGTQVVVLNNDTILVGVWGKIILARRY